MCCFASPVAKRMDQLYPIIRRARRPLIVNDAPPVAIAKVEPVQASNADDSALPKVETAVAAGQPLSGKSPDTTGEPPVPPVKASDAKISLKRSTR